MAWRDVFSNNFKMLLAKAGISQAEVARRIGKDAGTLSRTLKGENAPTLDTVDELAKALGVSASDLIANDVSNVFPQPRLDSDAIIAKLEEVRVTVQEAASLSEDELELVRLYRSCHGACKDAAMTSVRAFATGPGGLSPAEATQKIKGGT